MDLLAAQETLKRLLQHHSSKGSILWHSPFFIVQLSHLDMTTRKTTALTRWTFVAKVVSLLFNMLSRLVITFRPRSKRLLIAWLKLPSAVTICFCLSHLKREQPVYPKGYQSGIFIGRTDAEASTPILWPTDAKN